MPQQDPRPGQVLRLLQDQNPEEERTGFGLLWPMHYRAQR